MTHDTIVKDQVSTLEQRRHTIQGADITGYAPVQEVNGRVPDIVSTSPQGNRVLTEVETCDTIGMEHTKDQLIDLARARGGNTELHLVVPKSCLGEAQKTVKGWGITIDQWWSSGE
jgi:hypothetical protein